MSDNEKTTDYENKLNHKKTEEVILKLKDIEDGQNDDKEEKIDNLESTELNTKPVKNDIPSLDDLNNKESQKLTTTSESNNYIEISKRESKSLIEINNLNNTDLNNDNKSKENIDEENSLINNSINLQNKEEAVSNQEEVNIAKDENKDNKSNKNEQDSILILNSDLNQNLISENIKDDKYSNLPDDDDVKLDINNGNTNNKNEEIELDCKNQEKYIYQNDNDNYSNKSDDFNNNNSNKINDINMNNEESHGYLKNNIHLNKLLVTMNNETQNSYIPTQTSVGNKKEENIIDIKNSKKNYSIYNNPKFKNLLEELEKNCSPNIALNNLVNNSYKHHKQYSNVEYLDSKNSNNRYKEFYSILSYDMNNIIKHNNQNNQNKYRILTTNKSTIKEEVIYNKNPIVNSFSKNTQFQENKLLNKIEKYSNISTHRILSNNYNVSSSNIFNPPSNYYKNSVKTNSNFQVSKYESLFKNSSNLKKNYSLGNLATINYGCINNLNNFKFNNNYKSYNSSHYNGFTKYSNKDNLILLRSMPKLKYNEFKEKEHQFKSIYISNSSTLNNNNTNANNNIFNTNTNFYNNNKMTSLSLSTKNRNYNCNSTYDTENSSSLLFKKRIESIYSNDEKKNGINGVKINLYNESFKREKTAIYSNNERIIKQINNELNKNKFKFIELNRNLDKRNTSLN